MFQQKNFKYYWNQHGVMLCRAVPLVTRFGIQAKKWSNFHQCPCPTFATDIVGYPALLTIRIVPFQSAGQLDKKQRHRSIIFYSYNKQILNVRILYIFIYKHTKKKLLWNVEDHINKEINSCFWSLGQGRARIVVFHGFWAIVTGAIILRKKNDTEAGFFLGGGGGVWLIADWQTGAICCNFWLSSPPSAGDICLSAHTSVCKFVRPYPLQTLPKAPWPRPSVKLYET